jgi:UTP--glucose-1-phosphate uridylyltransferase
MLGEPVMNVTKAVITAAGRRQRTLPLQTLIDRDGVEKSVLTILIEEVLRAGIEEICVVIGLGDEQPYADVAGNHASRLHFVHQPEPLGHGHAVYCAHGFTGDEPFLHLVGDHLYVSRNEKGAAQQLVELAMLEACTISAVQSTRESLLPYYGAVGGRRIPGRPGIYQIETVIEKPTPTEAEQKLIVPGLRGGHYLCYFGMHVLTPGVMEILARQVARAQKGADDAQGQRAALPSSASPGGITLAETLAELARREQYLALELHATRYDVGVKYGLLTAQLALAFSGREREEVLSKLVELLAQREKP